jgi:hypothetical protein
MVIDAKIAVSALRAIADKKLGHLIGGYGPGGDISHMQTLAELEKADFGWRLVDPIKHKSGQVRLARFKK